MNHKLAFLLFLLSLSGTLSFAQKPFSEGIIIYKVKLESPDNTNEVSGTYTFVIKGNEVKKEIKLNNGYQDVVLLNGGNHKVYSLQNLNNRKYAIELNMNEMTKKQEKFAGYTIKNEQINSKNIAGYAVCKGNINYKDGSGADIYYTKEWRPVQTITFERFPDAKFLPMSFSYKEDNGMVMQFDIEKIEPGPVENAVFRIPPDYKMVSYSEYKQLSK